MNALLAQLRGLPEAASQSPLPLEMGARRHPLAPLRLRFGRWAYRFRLFAEQQSRLGEVINRSVEQHGCSL